MEGEAAELHAQIGLLSNTLSDFLDDDVRGRKVVVDRIGAKRAEWKLMREQIEYVENHGRLPHEVRAALSDEERERRDVELMKLNNNIRQAQSMIWRLKEKLERNRVHANSSRWEDQLAMYSLELQKLKLDKEIYG